MKTLVLINNQADAGRAARKWRSIAAGEGLFPSPPAVFDQSADWRQAIRDVAADGPALVVAAGGDGTVHRVANLILSLPAHRQAGIVLGAVGLGSGNDFHKPFNGRARIEGIPLRCRGQDAIRQNVLRVEYRDGQGRWRMEHVVTSCSLGAVALGNDLFNRRWGPVAIGRRLSPEMGIACASLAAVLMQHNLSVAIAIDGREMYCGQPWLAGVYVNRHFAGRLTYPGGVAPASTSMGVVALSPLGRWRRMALLRRAFRSGLPGPPHTHFWPATACAMTLDQPALMEMDGEVALADRIKISLMHGGLRVCP